MGAASHHQGPPIPGPRTRVFLHLGSTFGAAQQRAPSLVPLRAPCARGDATDGPQERPEMPPGSDGLPAVPHSGGCMDQTALGRPGPDDRPMGPFEQLVQLSLLAFSPSEVGGALIFEDQRHHTGEKMTNR